jgi:hypothetical protein
MNYVLAEMGRGDAGRISTLYDVRERLEPYGQAFLAIAIHTMEERDERMPTLADKLGDTPIMTPTGPLWHDRTLDNPTMSSDVRTTAVVLDALLQITPDQPQLPNVVRWLMTVREDGRWQTTQENAWSIISLTDWMVHTGELDASYDWSVTLNEGEECWAKVLPTESGVQRQAVAA